MNQKIKNYRDPICCVNCEYLEIKIIEVTGVSAFGECRKPYVDKRGRRQRRRVNVSLFGICDEHEPRWNKKET